MAIWEDMGLTMLATGQAQKEATINENFQRMAAAVNPYIDFDNFNRADSALTLGNTSLNGRAWQAAVGTWGISSNRAYAAALSGGTAITILRPSGSANARISALVPVLGTFSSIAGRYLNLNNRIQLYYDGTDLALAKAVAGVTTILDTESLTLNPNDRLTLSMRGSSLEGWVNGVVKVSATDSAHQTVEGVGLQVVDTTTRFDDFEVRPL